MSRQFGRPGPWVAGVAGPFVYLTKPSLAPVDHARLVRVAQTALGQEFGVRHVLDVREVARTCSPERADALLCRSLPVDIAADLFVELNGDDFFDAELDPGLAPTLRPQRAALPASARLCTRRNLAGGAATLRCLHQNAGLVAGPAARFYRAGWS